MHAVTLFTFDWILYTFEFTSNGRYERGVDMIVAALESRWHDLEHLNIKIYNNKQFNSLGQFSGSTSLELKSSLEGLMSLTTGAEITSDVGVFKSVASIIVSNSCWSGKRLDFIIAAT